MLKTCLQKRKGQGSRTALPTESLSILVKLLFYKLSEAPDITTDKNNNLKTFSVTLKRSGDQFLTGADEILDVGADAGDIAAGIEASRGKSLILWTKNNG